MENVVDQFVPRDHELIHLLDEQIAGHQLPYPLLNIVHDVRILDFHPAQLYEEYKEHEESGYIYFFDHREYQAVGGRPARATIDGRWKASESRRAVTRRGGVAGYKLTMVFFQKAEDPAKPDRITHWALNEYTRSGADDEGETLALYRLFKLKRAGW